MGGTDTVSSATSGLSQVASRSGQLFVGTGRLPVMGWQPDGDTVRWQVHRGNLVADEPTVRMSTRGPERPYRKHHPLAKPVRRGFLLALALLLVIAGLSVAKSLTAPGTDSTAARIAEWARDHGAGDLVTFLEKEQYQQNQ